MVGNRLCITPPTMISLISRRSFVGRRTEGRALGIDHGMNGRQ
jgi:hypothetical protein